MELVDGNIYLTRSELKGRSFLLGNKRAFSLSLPVQAGSSDVHLHSHKWFGAFHYGRKFLEAQVARAEGYAEHFLGGTLQSGFLMTDSSARREYQIEGRECVEEYFVPDGIQGMACRFSGDLDFQIEPEFDLRLSQTLSHNVDGYEIEEIEGGVLVSHLLPAGRYDDLSESFVVDGSGNTRLYGAVRAIGSHAQAHLLPLIRRSRHKIFRNDRHRHHFIQQFAPDGAVQDHAPLWNQSGSRVFAPVRLRIRGEGTVVYGFADTRDGALDILNMMSDGLPSLRVKKAQVAQREYERARFRTGLPDVDTAYRQVLTRVMDCLVARQAGAPDTALDRPATMILAGNQYFHDAWKRDENIALGFLLSLGFYDLARSVVSDTWQLQDVHTGRLPQRIRAGEEPTYHASDGTLWALHRLHQYWRHTGDDALLHATLPMVENFFRRSLERTVDGMLPSGRTTAPDYLWETWMDTAHTPRDGFPVEIQILWIASLRAFRPILKQRLPELEMEMETAEIRAWQALQRFNIRGLPADSLTADGTARDLITPNPYFCFGVGLDLGSEMEQVMRDVGRRQLAGRQGILTLAPQDWASVFPPEFLLDRRNVRGRRMRSVGKYNYHRGVEWNWLSTFFVQAELKYGDADGAYRRYVRKQVVAALTRGGIGGISELYDLSGARGPEFQAWSMAGFLEALHAFAGVQCDVPSRSIHMAPQLPEDWPEIDVRKWYGSVPFDVRYRRSGKAHSLRLHFPQGPPPGVEIEVSLAVMGRGALELCNVVGAHDVIESPRWERLPGTERGRIVLRLVPREDLNLTAVVRRCPVRRAATA